MKNYYFFGCSFTFGDEIVDEKFFPWKKQCKTINEFYSKKNIILKNKQIKKQYIKETHELAYPNLLSDENIKTHNCGIPGVSLKKLIFDIVKICQTSEPDKIFLQLPPAYRYPIYKNKFLLGNLTGDHCKDLTQEIMKMYDMAYFCVDDFLMIQLIREFLMKRNIDFYLINFQVNNSNQNYLKDRLEDFNHLRKDFEYIIDDVLEHTNLINIELDYNDGIICQWGHFDAKGHKIIADKLRGFM